MANETAPAATPAPAEAAPVQVRKPIGKASDHLTATAEPAKAGEGGEGAPKVESPEEAQLTSRLSKLASARAKFEADKKAHAAELERQSAAQAEVTKKAASWDALHEAKGKGEHLKALGLLYSQDEIDLKLYNELTRDILSREPGDKPLTEAQVRDLMKAEREAETAAETKRQAEQETARSTAARSGFLKHVADAFEASDEAPGDAAYKGAYSAIARFKVSNDEVMEFVSDYFSKHDEELPEPKAILDHFEAKLRGEMSEVLTPPAKLPEMVTDKARTGSTPTVAGRKESPKERWSRIKRELGILPAAS